MSAHDEAVEAEARQDEQIDEQRIAEAEGWLRGCWDRWLPAQYDLAWMTAMLIGDLTKPADIEPYYARLSDAYDVLGLSGVLRALARFVEEEERTR